MAETQVISKAEDDLAIRHDNDNDSANEGPPGLDDAEPQSGEPAKKRRRVVKPNPDKKFECKHEGCGKSYSRAEHLYRHQLNRESF